MTYTTHHHCALFLVAWAMENDVMMTSCVMGFHFNSILSGSSRCTSHRLLSLGRNAALGGTAMLLTVIPSVIDHLSRASCNYISRAVRHFNLLLFHYLLWLHNNDKNKLNNTPPPPPTATADGRRRRNNSFFFWLLSKKWNSIKFNLDLTLNSSVLLKQTFTNRLRDASSLSNKTLLQCRDEARKN